MNIKDLKTYSVPTFRGLDKENKLLKVEPFRAADGKNFIIDSDTLRTRPAIKYVDEIPFTIEADDYVIDWHQFKDVTLYITKKHFYASYNGVSVNEDNSMFDARGISTQIDFEGFEPIFREEKNALFIFGLNDIYVFSYIKDGEVPFEYIVYSLKQKPLSTYVSDSDFETQYNELPTAYEPVIFLGDNRFEDVNLLSNVRRYKMFASSGLVREGGEQSYYMPADFSFDKHVGYSFDVSFYEGKYDNLRNIYPIFLGVEGENFDTGTLSEYGILLNQSPTSYVPIQEVFAVPTPFEFFGTPEDASPTVKRKITGLDRDWFFRSSVLGDTNKDTFNYLMDYIANNPTALQGSNKVLAFNVPIEYTATYYDATDNFPKETVVERDTVTVYVQIKTLEIDSLNYVNEQAQGSEILTTQNIEDPTYPDYPETIGTFKEYVVDTEPLLVPSLSVDNFRTTARTIIREDRENIQDDEFVRVKAQYYEEIGQTSQPSAEVNPNTSNWFFFRENIFVDKDIQANLPDKNEVLYSSQEGYPAYPTPSVTPDKVHTLNNDVGRFVTGFDQSTFETDANAYLNANAASFTTGEVVEVRGKYYENTSIFVDASASINSDIYWIYYADYTFDQVYLDTQEDFYGDGIETITLNNVTSQDQSVEFFGTSFTNYLNANKEALRPYFNDYIRLVQTASYSSTETVYGDNMAVGTWSKITGPFPTNYELEFTVNETGNQKLYFDSSIAPYTDLIVGGNDSYRSALRFYDSSDQFISALWLNDYYTGELGGEVEITVPSLTSKVIVTVYKGYGDDPIADDNVVLDFLNNDYDIRLQTVSTQTNTTTTTGYGVYFLQPNGEVLLDEDITFNNSSTFPSFLPLDTTLPTLNPFFLTYNSSSPKTFVQESGFISALDSAITAKVDTEISDPSSGTAYAKVYVQGNEGLANEFGTSMIIRFSYQKSGNVTRQLRQSFNMTTTVSTSIDEDLNITWDDATTIDNEKDPESTTLVYPIFSNPDNDPVIELPLISQEGLSFVYNSAFVDNIESLILQEIPNLPGVADNTYSGFAKVKVQTEYLNDQKGVSIVIPFSYSKEFTLTTQRRQSMVYTAKIEKVQQEIEADLIEFRFDELEKRFELRLKDYFYDYNNEPSISVRVEYDRNPDYDLIAQNKFGISFGSENRLFLAGHPDYPNIDRFNVSNDLLGINQRSQSYELSYFPSKNYRVIGGKGAINGYVVATDTLLYVTKEDYPNDEKVFMRQRVLDDNGVVGYNEFKTNINKTPINHKSIVRFNNDVVMLTQDGLYAIEITENVLTDERLLKLRSGFINKDLVAKIENYDNDKIFILENNLYMYIFIGKDVYVADSRYTATNVNNIIENLSYEIVYWELPQTYKTGHLDKKTLKVLNETGKFMYTLDQTQNYDDNLVKYEQITNTFNFGSSNAFQLPVSLQDIVVEPEKYSIQFYSGYKLVAKENVDYTYDNGVVTYINQDPFRGVEPNKTYYFKDENGYYPFRVLSTVPLKSFTLRTNISGNKTEIYESIANRELYVSTIFTFNGSNYARLSPYVQSEVLRFNPEVAETEAEYTARLNENFKDYEDYFFEGVGLKDIIVNEQNPIYMLWISGISDLGNRLMEKKTYKFNVYATKKENENTITIGYTTRRRAFDETKNDLSVSNPNTFKRTSLFNYGSTTFRETGFSIPMKENNFLYIQFMLEGTGQVEVNGFDVLFVNNRLLKTVG